MKQRSQRESPRPQGRSGIGVAKPLSFAQERLWLLDEVAPLTMAMRLRGAINLSALEQTLRLLVERHSLLRTRFRLDCGAPVQETYASVEVEVPVIDLRALPVEKQQAVAEFELAAAAGRPLDLGNPPLFRPYLLRLAPPHQLLFIRISHLIVDEWSRRFLMQEIAAIYSALAAGEPLNLPPIRAQYGDYALWERSQLSDAAINAQLDFWKKYLAGLPPLLEIPRDYPRRPNRSYRGAWRSRRLAAHLSDGVKALARSEGVTAFHVLLAAFFAFLARQTGATDIAVGTPFSRRPDDRYARVVGPFVNSLVVRADCSGSPRFRAFVRHVSSRMVATLPHAHIPFEMVVERLALDRDPSYNPLIQAWFVYRENEPPASWSGPEVTPIEAHETVSPFDLALAVSELGTALECACSYDATLFKSETVDHFIDQYDRLLTGILEDPDRSIDEYDISPPERLRSRTAARSDAGDDMDSPASVRDAIMAVAARAPGAVAITSDAGRMTYAEVVDKAQELAARLREAGVSAESRVAVVMDRSLDLAVAILGVLEAGGVYLPLDAGAPQKSMLFILRDAKAACILTNKATRGRAPDAGIPVIVMDERPSLETNAPPKHSDSRARRASGANLCCVLYEPSDAGEPKGIALTHAAMINLLRSLTREIEVTPDDAMLAIAPTAFGLFMVEFLLPLVNGARVALAPDYGAANGAGLRSRVERDRVTIIQATPAIWRRLLDSGWQAAPGVRLLCGAEPLSRELARELLATGARVWNCYGFTETTIYSTFERIACPDDVATIGRPVANASIYVLDRRQRHAPIGALGEIYIGGDGLARERSGRAALAAERFLPDPFSPRPGSRMWASGDLGRYRPDGRIERHARRSNRVMIDDHSVDLNAVSEALDAHPMVRCSVAIRRTEAQGPRLIAYAASAAPERLSRADLWDHLAQRLPSYMLPSAIALLDALPLTNHGRIDLNALPAPRESDFRYAPAPVEPRTPSEEAVAAIWREALGRQDIGVKDDFFALGGNSLQVARALQAIRARCGVKCPPQTFFKEPTIAALAEYVDRAQASSSAPQLTITPIPRDGDLELAPQQENWWYNEFFTGQVHPNNLHFGIRLTGPLRLAAIEQSVAMLQRRHEALRTAFAPKEGGGAAVLIMPPDACELQVVYLDLSHLAPDVRLSALRSVSQQENGRPFDLTRGNLCRVILARLDAEDHVALLTIHHLVFDEWSMGIFLKDISTLYASAVNGEPSPLRPLEFQYVDFARWQRNWLSSPAAAEQFSFWRRRLAPPLPPLLPAGDDDGILNGVGLLVRGRAPFVIGPQAAEAARRLARGEKRTLFSVFMAVIKTVLYAYARQPDLRIGTLVANRNLPGAEHVIGLFLNAVCLRTRIDPDRPFKEFLREVHSTIADATANQDLPYEIMARDLEATQQTSSERLLQAMAVWRAMPPPERLRFPAITPSSYQVDDDATESLVFARNAIDLRFELVETPTVVTGNITYNLSLFTISDIREMASAMEQCLMLVDMNPEAPLAELCERLPSRAGAPAGPAAGASHG